MKLILFSVLTLIASFTAYSQSTLTIQGAAPLLKNGTEISIQQVLPRRFSNSPSKKYVVRLNNNKFAFTFNINGGEMYFLEANKHATRMFLEPGKADIIITDSLLKQVSINGNTAAIEYNNYVEQFKTDSLIGTYNAALKDYYNYLNNKQKDSVITNRKRRKMEGLLPIRNQAASTICLNVIKQHPDSYANTYILYDLFTFNAPEHVIKKAFDTLPQAITKNSWGKEFRYRIDSLFVGGKAPAFTQTDTAGKPVSLANYKGKYVLLDFWASWCVPCRADNPNQVKAVQKFKSRNFAMVSISLDEKKDAWLKAIKQDGLNWTHLSDLKEWDNEVSVKYYVYSIPNNYLIDPNGKIIAKDLHGDELIVTLDRLIK